jgi:hypothetical protein
MSFKHFQLKMALYFCDEVNAVSCCQHGEREREREREKKRRIFRISGFVDFIQGRYASKLGPTIYDLLDQRTIKAVHQKLQLHKEGCYSESHNVGNDRERVRGNRADLVYDMFSDMYYLSHVTS